MKTKRQIKNFILKTLLPYKEDMSKCAYDKVSGLCLYLTDDGRKCAVGRWLKKGEWQEIAASALTLFELYGFDILLKPARDMNFTDTKWKRIQSYHDKLVNFKKSNSDNDKRACNNAVENLEIIFRIELPELRI
jgi:hypothetical protein